MFQIAFIVSLFFLPSLCQSSKGKQSFSPFFGSSVQQNRPYSPYPNLRTDDGAPAFSLPLINKDFVLPEIDSYQISSQSKFNPSSGRDNVATRPTYLPRPSYQPEKRNGTSDSIAPSKRQGETVERAVANASNLFGFDLYLHTTAGKQNVLYSPISLSTALAMLFMGSRGNTEKEIAHTLKYDRFGLDQNNVHPAVQALMSRLSSDSSFTLDMINLILVQTGFALGKEYHDAVYRYYKAALQNVDFEREGEQAVNRLNGFVAHTTRNKVPQALDSPLDPTTKTFLMNVIYFKGQWQTRFDERFTRPSTFYNRGEIPRTVPMMNMKSKLPFAVINTADTYALELPYEGSRVSMLILLPKLRQGLPALESSFLADPQRFLDLLDFQDVMVDLSLPRFSLTGDLQAKEALRALGIVSAFDSSRANLSGISRDLYVTRVIHRAVMEVNEEGSEASAFSGIATGIRIGGPPAPLFTVDHPFLFLIRDRSTGAILFLGRVTEL